jgi:hypothetical protein
MTSPFRVWEYRDQPKACSLSELQGVDRQIDLRKGVSRLAGFPAKARSPMSPDFPKNTLLLDNVLNTDGLIIVSSRLKDFLEARQLVSVEFLPVMILSHKKKPLETYFIVHPVDLPSCLDVKASRVKWDVVDKTHAQRIERLVIDASKVESGRSLFKPRPFYDAMVVRKELAEAIDAGGFSGIRWVEPPSYK